MKPPWSEINPYLDRALDLHGAERDAWVAELATTHPEIASGLRQLLARHALVESQAFLSHSSPSFVSKPDRAGAKIGAYTLERLLGRGGMGEVWLAARSDGRFEGKCAIKFLDAAGASAKLTERFRHEGSFLARLTHPNISRLLDAGTADGQPYLALEFVDGVRIDQYCDEQKLSVRARVRLFIDVVAAVAHAHSQLIIHRDLKPSNVLVTTAGTVKLLDFGIAKLLSADADMSLTRLEETALTPEYAAPEQLLGELPSTATDVYQLGMLLYVLLAGSHPLSLTGTRAERMRAALEEVVPLASAHVASSLTFRHLRKYLHGDLDAILAKALRKSASERYTTAQALQDDIQRYLSNEPVQARRGAAIYRARKFALQHRVELGAVLVIGIALLASAAFALQQARTSAHERDRALEGLRRAEALNDFSSFLLTEATPRAGKPISNAELLAAGEALVERRHANDPQLRVHLLLALAERYEENQQFDDWQRVLQRAYDESRAVDDAGLHAYATCAWAQHFVEQGESAKALRLIEGALPAVTDNPDFAEYEAGCRIIQSITARRLSDGAQAVVAAERAVAIESLRPGISDRELQANDVLASALNQSSRFTAAIAAYERLAQLMNEQGLDETRGAAIFYNNWAATLLDSGQSLRALPIAARAVQTARASDSQNGPSLSMLTTYGLALTTTGDHAAAATTIDAALAKGKAAGSSNRMIGLLSIAITAATNAHDWNRAARLLREAEQLLNVDQSKVSLAVMQAATARIAVMKGDSANAVAWARRAYATFEAVAPTSASMVATRTLLARSLNADRQYAEALTLLEKNLALVLQLKSDLPYTSTAGAVALELAIAQKGLGNLGEAQASIEQALLHLNATVGAKAEITERARRFAEEISAVG